MIKQACLTSRSRVEFLILSVNLPYFRSHGYQKNKNVMVGKLNFMLSSPPSRNSKNDCNGCRKFEMLPACLSSLRTSVSFITHPLGPGSFQIDETQNRIYPSTINRFYQFRWLTLGGEIVRCPFRVINIKWLSHAYFTISMSIGAIRAI